MNHLCLYLLTSDYRFTMLTFFELRPYEILLIYNFCFEHHNNRANWMEFSLVLVGYSFFGGGEGVGGILMECNLKPQNNNVLFSYLHSFSMCINLMSLYQTRHLSHLVIPWCLKRYIFFFFLKQESLNTKTNYWLTLSFLQILYKVDRNICIHALLDLPLYLLIYIYNVYIKKE